MVRKILWFIVIAVLVGIQFVPVNRENPDEHVLAVADRPVQDVLERSCFDCHSNRTKWPWYAYVAPISWRVAGHVEHARQELNFSTWPSYSPREKVDRLEEIVELTQEGEMPLPDYLLLHQNARLSQRDLEVLKAWSEKEIVRIRRSVSPTELVLPERAHE